ncbi:MAG: DUF5011 domain-containing protein, partial [Verrucomicrobia bacterium]|nr:DUF5011 domain-containing protein [Verrucomicrobiota bacterium]
MGGLLRELPEPEGDRFESGHRLSGWKHHHGRPSLRRGDQSGAGYGSYTDAGASATDNVDSTVTVNSNGTVDPTTPGTYTITYDAMDVAGNAAATVTRTVVVYDPAAGFASRLTSVTVPGTHAGWDVSGATANSMTLVGNFKWQLLFTFSAPALIEYKVVGNG